MNYDDQFLKAKLEDKKGCSQFGTSRENFANDISTKRNKLLPSNPSG
jgi:hypothetical protein